MNRKGWLLARSRPRSAARRRPCSAGYDQPRRTAGNGRGLRAPSGSGSRSWSGPIQPVWDENWQAHGADQVWQPWRREGVEVARRTVERRMRRLGLKGVRRGQPVNTTVSHPEAAGPEDRVNRRFTAERPNALWVSAIPGAVQNTTFRIFRQFWPCCARPVLILPLNHLPDNPSSFYWRSAAARPAAAQTSPPRRRESSTVRR
jgi:hypothetical protein